VAESLPERRPRGCVENWPEAETGAYDPRCCRFPKSCSATVYDEAHVAETDLEPSPAAEPQQADVSTLLRLVDEFGDLRYAAGDATMLTEDRRINGLAAAVRARIAAVLPQQPVQARSREGSLLWQHTCGSVFGISVTPMVPGPCADCADKDDPWRPLLVGGTPAPENDPGAPLRCPGCGAVDWSITGQVWECKFCRVTMTPRADRDRHEPHLDGPREPTAEERAEHDLLQALAVDRLDEVLPAIAELREQLRLTQQDRHRDGARLAEALAEVERLKAELAAEEEGRREDWVGRLTSTQSDPLVLSLPEVPEGAVALIGVRKPHRRYPFHAESGGWRNDDGDGAPWKFSAVLHREHPEGVTAEMAPPREPRTWPVLADAPDDLPTLRGRSGAAYGRSHFAEGVPVYRVLDDLTGELEGRAYSFYALQGLDGPLTEVFDEPGGAS